MPSTPASARPVPVWARALDIVCLLLAFIAVIVSMSGGFRYRLAGLRVAVTSPFPLLIWAIVIGAVRHVVAPQQPLYREFPARLSAWLRLPQGPAAATVVAGAAPAHFPVSHVSRRAVR